MNELPEMPCRELVEVITDYLEDALAETDRRRFEAHLEDCDACQDYVEQFRRTVELTGRLEGDRVPPQMQQELLTAFRGWRAR